MAHRRRAGERMTDATDAYEATVTARLDVPLSGLSGAALEMWAAILPPSAQITAVMGERGSQRAPEPFLRALVAKWSQPLTANADSPEVQP